MLSCVWLFCNPMDCSPPGSSVHGISLAKILEWIAIPFSRGYSWPRDQTHVSWGSCIGRWILYHWTTWEDLDYFKVISKTIKMLTYSLIQRSMYIYTLTHTFSLLNKLSEKKKNVKIKSCLQRCAGPFTVILTLRLPRGTAITFSSPRKEHKTNVIKLLH